MTVISIFAPHILALLGAIAWCLVFVGFAGPRVLSIAVLSLPAYSVLFMILLALTPRSWLWAKPTQDQNADVAIVLSFGYELNGEQMMAGEANRFLWRWLASNKSTQIKAILLQEGIWVAADEDTSMSLKLERERIHKHDPDVYVDTLNAAFCAIQHLRKMGKNKALLVAHDLQLRRVAWNFERISQAICPDCTFAIPEIRDTPYPLDSVHWQTRNEFVYKIVELLIARPRDFLRPIPTKCKALMTSD